MGKRKSLIFVAIFAIVVSTFLVACGNSNSSSGDKKDKSLVIAIGSDIISFDIHNHNNTSTESVHQNMFDYLFKRDENNEIKPDLVETYKIVKDTTLEAKLKEGVKFHNGDPLTSEDVKYTLERVAKDETLKEYPNYKQIKEVQIIDDLNFKIITYKAEPSLLHRLSRLGSGILPSKYIKEKGFDYFLEHPIGTGPYKFKEWVRDEKVVFEPFKDYFKGKVDTWDKVTFRVIPENSTRVSELLTGGVDIATNIPPSDWKRVEDNDRTSLKQEISNRTIMLILRATKGYPTSDVRVRQAIDYAIDDKSLAENALKGGGIPTLTKVGPGNFGANPDLYDQYHFDIDKAKALLKEAGYEKGFEMTLHSPKGRYLQDAEVTEMIAGMLSKVNIKVKIDFMEWSNFVEMRTAKKNKDAYLLGLGNSMFDGAYAVDWYRAERNIGETDYKNNKIEKLLEESASNMDAESRTKQLQEIESIVAEDVPHIHLYQEKIYTGVNDRVDYTPTQDEMLYVPTIKRK